ncbi:phage tail protein [Clostridium sp. CX1]|uniref:phage tail protein n=1 Tax=Clostridium sp. CX1 TaxID=2978346 RepID=UPI0021BE3527|nr:phage tail protein [Clostridium sp. CX1]MCT8978312.1 phage tail protein [Clostridium sp. CX1]
MGMIALHFFPQGSRKNKIVIGRGSYHKGSAKLTPDSSGLVNKLWVKGGKAISELYTQNITVTSSAIQLDYSPREPVAVQVGGIVKTLGIQNIHQPGQHDFLLNVSEKLLIPDLCTSGTGTISYCYEYPIKILVEEPISQEQYGVFEDILNVETDDKELALELGLKHLWKYSQPIIIGSIKPFEGVYKPGEIIKVELPDLNVDTELQIKEVSYDSAPRKPLDITLQLETAERDLSNILKDMNQRLAKLEKETYKDDEGPIEKYIAKEELFSWREVATVPQPIQDSGWLYWNEDLVKVSPSNINENINWIEFLQVTSRPGLYPLDNLYPSEDLYPM